jgi:hypothetical protein
MNRREFLKKTAEGISIFPFLYLPSFNIQTFSNKGVWPHLRQWNSEELDKFSQWVNNIYQYKKNGSSKQKSAKPDSIFRDNEMNLLNNPHFSKGNKQLSNSDLELLKNLTHCGSFPAVLKTYYEYRRGLPSVISKIASKKGGDLRYSQGNYPKKHFDSISFKGSFSEFISHTLGYSSGSAFLTGNFRTDPFLERTDSIPIAIEPEFIKPGTVAYNPNGHILVVGNIDKTGEVNFLDSHPDHSVTYTKDLSALGFVKSAEDGPEGFERCYSGFRMLRLSKISSNKAELLTNEEMIPFGFSVQQYKDQAKIKKGEMEIRGEKIQNFPSLVRSRLRQNKSNLIEMIYNFSEEYLEMMKSREEFVQDAWSDVLKYGPITFPNNSQNENIYQANGRWEIWSSPSSDIDRKNKYIYLVNNVKNALENFGNNSSFDYSKFQNVTEMAEQIRNLKTKLFSEKKFKYQNSKKQEVELSLLDIEQRLFDLSFNPNHCPELRWGAPPGKERKYAVYIRTPLRTGGSLSALESYEKEEGLRFYLTRQNNPTSLDSHKNPQEIPIKFLDELLNNYLN